MSLETKTIEISGLTFRVDIEQDNSSGRPWEECDGYGPVREATRNFHHNGGSEKRAGEIVLHAGDRNHYTWLYDWAGAMKLAKKDGWGVSEEHHPEGWDALTEAQKREVAVQRDFDFLQAWCDEEWVWVGVTVTLQVPDEDGDLVDYEGPLEAEFHDSLWGMEYWVYHMGDKSKNTHVEETAQELAQGVAKIYLREQAEAGYWAERDVVTV